MNKFCFLFIGVMVMMTLVSCSNTNTKSSFTPLHTNPDYAVIVKRDTSNHIYGYTIVQGTAMQKMVHEVNTSKKQVASMSCPASTIGYDVMFYYGSTGSERSFEVLGCPGTTDNLDQITLTPGITANLEKYLKNRR